MFEKSTTSQTAEWDMVAAIRTGNGYLDAETVEAHMDELVGVVMEDGILSSVSLLKDGRMICELADQSLVESLPTELKELADE